ncbi:MmcQ/YjbR family DNA-binding protein [Hymenobacter chitinivorans]|uniref:Putative DNA-binding protein (MmcQ/YjbR family) n=1 Tax=Hymenobacter chitinivorans DSM 11115 TaxID=1121954 RepID=A0A2M9BM70_9BACT|nr:MmcQ/YjbR family DNA-binding protein [Hymenobacter chitinivorans]PJJ59054.1 putative DNA-binding protein (MmcQ/YjbR family) [Hymenobacter chitinivorans DSM 11115]
MTVAELQAICHTHAGVTESIKWDNHLCFCVGEKMFLVTAPDGFPVSAAFKVTDDEFDELRSQPGFAAHQYLGRFKWVYLDDVRRLDAAQWRHYIGESYQLIFAKLPAKLRRQLHA